MVVRRGERSGVSVAEGVLEFERERSSFVAALLRSFWSVRSVEWEERIVLAWRARWAVRVVTRCFGKRRIRIG